MSRLSADYPLFAGLIPVNGEDQPSRVPRVFISAQELREMEIADNEDLDPPGFEIYRDPGSRNRVIRQQKAILRQRARRCLEEAAMSDIRGGCIA